METYKLNSEQTGIDQQPEMKEPDDSTGWSEDSNGLRYKDEYHRLLDKEVEERYQEHIASLKHYDISGIIPESWKTGRDLIPLKDFTYKYGNDKGETGNGYEEMHVIGVVPIVKEVEVNESEDIHIKYHDLNIKYMAALDKIVELETENFGLKQEIRNMTEEIYKYQP